MFNTVNPEYSVETFKNDNPSIVVSLSTNENGIVTVRISPGLGVVGLYVVVPNVNELSPLIIGISR